MQKNIYRNVSIQAHLNANELCKNIETINLAMNCESQQATQSMSITKMGKGLNRKTQ